MIGKDKVVQPQKSSLQTRCHGSIHVQSTPLALHLNVAAIDPTQAMNIGFCGERNEKGNWDMGLVILTGASGSVKTTIAKTIEVEHPSIAVLRFDTIGVPSAAVMATWERAFNLEVPGNEGNSPMVGTNRADRCSRSNGSVRGTNAKSLSYKRRSLPPQSRTRVFSVSNVMTPPEHAV